MIRYYLGLDIGSTTVKGVFLKDSGEGTETLWKSYERHETKQAEKLLEYLTLLENRFPDVFFPGSQKVTIGVTGSGGAGLAGAIGARFYQEVLCVTKSAQTYFPKASSVIELGGQDAKIILFKEDEKTGRRKKMMTMNDKCAGGTGAVIDKIAGKLHLLPEDLKSIHYDPDKVHSVAGKCGVFAETDINSLQKQGVSPDELMISLFDAIVQQNLSVLTRGNTLRPEVLLLGGPNTFLPGLQEAWRKNLAEVWRTRNLDFNESDLIQNVYSPDSSEYFAALGTILVHKENELDFKPVSYPGSRSLLQFIEKRRRVIGANQNNGNDSHLVFKKKYVPAPWIMPIYPSGAVVQAYLGLDGGSTSTKGVLIDKNGELLASEYLLSNGNPIDDAIQIIQSLHDDIEKNGAQLQICGAGTTGYAKELLKEIFQADVAVVETVAHTLAAQRYYDDVDVIVDVGGQDIKLIHIKDGKVKDFKLNTQCSAGNGYFLQNTAEGFGYEVDEYANVAFSAKKRPRFGYGCAVFLQTDIVDFQRQGWEAPEILAGLAEVLPRNIWQYVAKIPNPSVLGRRFLLQGGTQKNIAAAKAQVDYIHEKFEGLAEKPEVFIHKYTSVCGAIGAALEASKKVTGRSSFIGLEETETIHYVSRHDESTRCYFCKNKCVRTFIDVKSGQLNHKRRFIVASCEKGEVEQKSDLRSVRLRSVHNKKDNPNLSEVAAKKAWKNQMHTVAKIQKLFSITEKKEYKRHEKKREARKHLKIGIPRALNHYAVQPFFTAYFQALGFEYSNIIFSDYTSEKLYKEGSKSGTVDPCFPAKVALAHVYNLWKKEKEEKPDYIFFPIINAFDSGVKNVVDNRACPTAAGAPEMAYAALTKESDIFAAKNIKFLKPMLFLENAGMAKNSLWKAFHEILHLGEAEHRFAVKAAFRALKIYQKSLEREGMQILRRMQEEKKVAILLLGRVYHNDEGINHSILEKFQSKGYPVLTIDSLPKDHEFLKEVFSFPNDENYDPMEISDVWKNSFSSASSKKVWAAKFAARHPHIIPLELSNFKCGHDSTLYSVIEKIVESLDTPYFSFKDIDENNPTGSIKIRVETIDYFLQDYMHHVLGRPMETGEEALTV